MRQPGEVHLPDGFDRPETVALGLGAAQLMAVVASLLSGWALLQTPLPPAVCVPLAVVLLGLGVCLGWLRLDGRPALEWAGLGAAFLLRRRTGTLVVTAPARPPGPAADDRSEDAASTGPAWAAPRPASPAAPGRRAAPGEPPIRARGRRRITFFSLRGGSGRTTLATELACLAAAEGRWEPEEPGAPGPLRVALIDAEALAGTVAVRLGLPQSGLWQYALGLSAAAGTAVGVDHPCGVRVLPGCPAPLPEAAQGSERGQLAAALERLEADGVQLVVIDAASDLGPLAAWALESASVICIVVTPTAGGVQDLYASAALLRRQGHRGKLACVLNRSRGDLDLAEPLADVGCRLLGEVPLDPRFDRAENRHQPLVLSGPSPALSALRSLAAELLGSPLPQAGGTPPARREGAASR